jgi:hypothetical protein
VSTLRVELLCFLFSSLFVIKSVGIATDLKQSANLFKSDHGMPVDITHNCKMISCVFKVAVL